MRPASSPRRSSRSGFHAYSYAGLTSGFGPLWSYLALPLLLVYAWWLVRHRRDVLLNVLVPVVAMFLLQPYRWWSRFTMVLAAIGAIAIVHAAERLRGHPARLANLAVLGLVALGVFFPTFKIDGIFWASRIVATARIPAEERSVGRLVLPAYRWVDGIPAGATIGVDTYSVRLGGEPYILPYPLFGTGFDHRVYPLRDGSASSFASQLAESRIDYVMVVQGRRLDRWTQAAMHAGCARRISQGTTYGHRVRAYRLVPACERRRSVAVSRGSPQQDAADRNGKVRRLGRPDLQSSAARADATRVGTPPRAARGALQSIRVGEAAPARRGASPRPDET